MHRVADAVEVHADRTLAGLGVGLDERAGREAVQDEILHQARPKADHEIVRQGLRSLLSEEHDVAVVGEAANGREAVDLALRLEPDVIIMDMSMPGMEGHEATRQIRTYLPKTRVIAMSMYDHTEKIEAMSRARAERYVLKTAPSEELLAAVRGASPEDSEILCKSTC